MYDDLHAHLHAPGAEIPRGGGRHRRDRRHRLARIPGARRLGRGRDRLLRPLRLRGQRRAGRSASRRRPARAAPARTMQKVATPGKKTCEDVAELLGCRCSARSSRSAGRWTRTSGAASLLLIRGDHELNEIKAQQVRAWRIPLRDARRRSRGALQLRAPAISARSALQGLTVIADRTVAAMSDFVCGANEADFHLRGVNLGRDCREPAGRRHPQRRRGRPVARRQGHARDRARHRGRPHLPARAPSTPRR